MRHALTSLLLGLAVTAGCHRPISSAPAGAPKAVFIILDGIPADVVERVPTPAIDAIAQAGGYARAHVGGALGGATQTPTISAPGYMSLLTGTWANKHNVWNNNNQSPNYAYWNLFRIVETVDPARRTALFSTWIDNRTVLIGAGKPNAGTFALDKVADGFELDSMRFPRGPESAHIRAIDDHVSAEAAAHIAAEGPDLTWVYLEHTDDVAHAHGDSEALDRAVRDADARVGKIWAAVQQRQARGERWMIVVTTDHGRDPTTGKGHGGQSTRERTTWIATNQRSLTSRFTNGEAAIVDIAPSILQHLGVAAPAAVARQMDGVSFLRPTTEPAPPIMSGNPILPGWYADPEAHVFEGRYWIFPTYSAAYNQQTFMDAFSSTDLVTWTKHERVLDTANVKWATRAMWAPSIVKKGDWYYLFFGANDIQNDQQRGGIGVARARTPAGPFVDYLGKPLIDRFHNGAQPIDQFVFQDVDGSYYIVYGGWKHCNIAKLNSDFTGFVPFPDGSTFKEITPSGFVEGAYMLRKDGRYYFMWSEGGWTGPNYAVAYAVGDTPFGPFERIGTILQQDSTVARGAGHHSVLHVEGSDRWYIVYHRRPLGDTGRDHRAVSIEALHFDADGRIRPVRLTTTGVARDPLPSAARPPR